MSICDIQIMYVFLFIMFQPKSGYIIGNVINIRFNYRATEFKNYLTSQKLLTNMIGCNKYHCIILFKYELLMGLLVLGITIYIDGFVQDCSSSTANAPGILQTCTKPSVFTCSWRKPPSMFFLTMSLSKLPSWWPAVICQMEAMSTTGHSYKWNIKAYKRQDVCAHFTNHLKAHHLSF